MWFIIIFFSPGSGVYLVVQRRRCVISSAQVNSTQPGKGQPLFIHKLCSDLKIGRCSTFQISNMIISVIEL